MVDPLITLRARLKARRVKLVSKFEAAEISQLQDFRHLLEIDLIDCVGHLMVIGMKTGEPPDRRESVHQKRVMIAAEENAVISIAIPLIRQVQADGFVLALDRLTIIRAVIRADKA